MTGNWYVQVMGEEIGPLTDGGLHEMVAKRQLAPDDYVRKGTTDQWVSASRVRGLFQQTTTHVTQSDFSENVAAPPATIHPPLLPAHQSEIGAPIAAKFKETWDSRLTPCPDCQQPISQSAKSCPNCGHPFLQPSRIVAIALAWTLGGIGAHKFYLKKPDAVMYLLFCWTFIPALFALVEGFQYLSLGDDEFVRLYGSRVTKTPTARPKTTRTAHTPVQFVELEADQNRQRNRMLTNSRGRVWIFGAAAAVLGLLAIIGGTRDRRGAGEYSPSEHDASGKVASDLDKSSYSLISDQTLAGEKRNIEIRLRARVSEDALRAIALELRDSDPQQYRRTYIAYYLPDMDVNTGAWALAQFAPDLSVEVIGVTLAQESAHSQLPITSPSRDAIGSWWDERPMVGNKMTFYRENGSVFMENKFDDGNARVVELRDVAFRGGRAFSYKRDNGTRFLINASGNLEWWDEDGHFLTSRRAD